MNLKNIFIFFALSALYLTACKDPYNPAIKNLDKEILVVEGFIDGADVTDITLSRVRSMGAADTNFQKYVTNAQVLVEDDGNAQFALFNTGDGHYKGQYAFAPEKHYRIRIRMADHREYVSAFVPYKISPPVDSISYRIEPGGARFFVSTHDNSSRSKYYRWKYEETWEFHSSYHTQYRYNSDKVKVVDFSDSVYQCWQFNQSKELLITSTEKLSSDNVNQFPLLFIENGHYKLSFLYSIFLSQYAMDSLGYNYYRQLKKNTEETGSIFDPQPGNLRGNIFNTKDSSEIVVGYIGAGSSYRTRQFFRVPWNYQPNCTDVIMVPNMPDSLQFYFEGGYWPVGEQKEPTGTTYIGARTPCVDCTLRGTNIKPSYWP